jgi:hypothetical protein
LLAVAVNVESVFARIAAGVACSLGLGIPLFLLVMARGIMRPEGYLWASVPLIPGLATVAMIRLARKRSKGGDGDPEVRRKGPRYGVGLATSLRFLVAVAAFGPVVYMVHLCNVRPIGDTDPRDRIRVGMMAEEVRIILGEPHSRSTDADGKETWIYMRDWTGFSYFGVIFDKESRVEFRWLE